MLSGDDLKKWREEQYKIAVDVRRLEIENFSKRSLFFWGFIVAAGVGYAGTPENHYFLRAVLAHLGFLASLAWYFVNRGSKYWQMVWEEKVNNLESHLAPLFIEDVEIDLSNPIGPGRYSVTKTTTLLSLIVTAAWIEPIFEVYRIVGANCYYIILSVVTITFAVLLRTVCRTSRPATHIKAKA